MMKLQIAVSARVDHELPLPVGTGVRITATRYQSGVYHGYAGKIVARRIPHPGGFFPWGPGHYVVHVLSNHGTTVELIVQPCDIKKSDE